MSSIDERIVSMQFDNKQFESGVQTTMSTLDKLKEKLSFKNAGDGLQGLTQAANKVDFGSLSINIEGITAKFTAFQSFVHGIFESLGQDVYNFGKRMVTSLTTDQLSAGWSKYGEMATSVASIIAATGQSQETTYEQLDKLNWFSDATSYSLTQMTGAYSKFAAAGVEAQDSMQAIMGLATASSRAGISASDSRFNNVLYNVAQAMGMGYMGTMDWKSLELAGIATVEFKQKLIDVGVEMGKLQKVGDKVLLDGMEVTAENLRETLSKKWVDKDVMLSGFGAYGGFVDEVYKYATTHGVTAEEAMQALADTTDQFGYAAMRSAQETKTWAEAVDATKDAVSTLWMKIFQDVIGNYEEAKEVWGAVAGFLYDSFAAPLEKVENILGHWKAFKGRDYMFEGLKNAFSAIGDVLGAVGDAFDRFWPKMSNKTAGQRLVYYTKRFLEFTESMKPSEETLQKITTAFGGLASIFDLVKTVAGNVWDVIKNLFSSMNTGGATILDAAAALGEWITQTVEAIKQSELFNGIFDTLSTIAGRVGGFLGSIIPAIMTGFAEEGGGVEGIIGAISSVLIELSSSVVKLIQDLTGWDLSGWFSALQEVFIFLRDTLISVIELITGEKDLSVWETIKKIFSDLNGIIGPIVEKVGSFFGSMVNGAKNLIDKIDFSKVTGALQSVWDWIKKVGTKIWEFIKDLASSIKNLDFSDLTNIFGGVAVGGAGLGIWSLVDKIKELIGGFGKTKEKAGGFKDFLDGIKNAFVDFSDALKKSVNVNMILKLAGAVLVLAESMNIISKIPQEQMTSALLGVTALLGDCVGALFAMSKMDINGNMKKAAEGMLIIAGAVFILAEAVEKLSALSWEELAKGMAAVTVMLGELAGFTQITEAQDLVTTGIGLAAVAEAVKILAKAAKEFGSMEWEALGKAGAAITVLLGALAGFTQIVGDPKGLIATGLGLIVVAEALNVLTGVAEAFGSMEWESLGKAGAAIVVLLAALGGFTRLADPKGIIATGLGMIELAYALKILAGVAEDFGNMEWESLGKAGAAIVVLLGALAGFTVILDKFGGGGLNLVAMGAGLVLVGSGLKILSNVVAAMGQLSWEEIGKGLAVVGALLLEMSVALVIAQGTLLGAASLTVLAVALNALIVPLLVFSNMTWEEIGKGLATMGGALAILVVAGAAAVAVGPGLLILAAAIAALGVSLVAAGAGIAALSVGIATFSAMGIGAIEIFVAGIGLVITSILTMLPNIATALAASIVVFIATIGNGAATILKAIVALGSAILDALIELVPKIVELVITTLSAILEGLIELVPQVLELVGEIIMGILELLLEAVPKVIEIIFAALTSIIEGLTEFIPKVVQLAVACLKALIEAIVELIPTIVDAALQILTGILQAIADNLPDIIQAGVDIVVAFVEGIGTAIPQLIEAAYQMMIDLINGMADAIENNTETLLDAIDRLIWAIIDAAVAVLTHAVENFKTAGKNLMNSGLIQGIKDKWEAVKTAVKTAITAAKNKITEKVNEWLDAGKTLLTNVIDGFKKKVTDIKDSISNIINTAKQVIVDKVTEWIQMGKDLIQGFINGIFSKKSSVSNAVEDTMENATKTGKKPWLMKSPSRLTRQWGIYVDEGFILGVEDKADAVADSTEDMAKGAINALTSILGKDLDFGDNLEPVITPVMDLTEIQNGVDDMNSMFGDRSMSMYGASDVSRLMSGGRVDLTQQAISQLQDAINRMAGRTGTTNNNTFNIQGDDPEAIALEVSRILQTDVERTGAVWA